MRQINVGKVNVLPIFMVLVKKSFMPEIIRTPEERFSDIKDWTYEPKYVQIGDTRMHYVDEGQGEVVLCLHGEPSWGYLYRKFIPILSPKYRVIAPDLIGFGRSDKYCDVKDYTFDMHFKKLKQFIDELNLFVAIKPFVDH